MRRKPEPLGVELKTIGDAMSGLLLIVEIVRGKAEVVKPPYYDPQNSVGATTAQTLRLSEPWFGSGRVVAGAPCLCSSLAKFAASCHDSLASHRDNYSHA